MITKTIHKTRRDGVTLYLYQSDSGCYIRQLPTGIIYNCAIDIEDAPYTYSESDEKIETEENHS